MKIRTFVFNMLQENTYVLYDDSGECVIIDPGCAEAHEEDELKNFISAEGLQVRMLINTHCHIDHVLGNYFVKKHYNTKLYIHEIEEPYLKAVKTYAGNYGYFQYQETEADEFIPENSQIKFGNQTLDVLFVPGHSPGHIALYSASSNCVIAGDVLFYNSIGRTDLPGGNYNTLIESIHKKLFSLPDNTVVYPGHGPKTSIGFEKKTNPFCALTLK